MWSVDIQFYKMTHSRFFSVVLKFIFNKYTITIAVFLVFLTFFDDRNLLRKQAMKQEIKSLEMELAQFHENIERSREEVKRLTTDSLYLEKVAREKYLMKRDNEDIFLFNETAQ